MQSQVSRQFLPVLEWVSMQTFSTHHTGKGTIVKYLVSYDLMSEGQDYPKIEDELNLELLGIKVLRSQWIVESDMSASVLLEHLRKFVDSNDKLLILRLPGRAGIAARDGIAWVNPITNPDTLR